MRKRKSKANWLLTYSDMVTLLLVFFIVLIAIPGQANVTSKIFLFSFLGNIGLLNGGNSIEVAENKLVTLGNRVTSLPASQVTRQNFNKGDSPGVFLFNNLDNSRRVRVIENREGIVISLFTDIFFNPNSDKLNYESVRDTLETIRNLIDRESFKGEILINGHTDNVPYEGSQFQDNWELSMARALTVFNALRRIPFVYPLDTKKVSVHAYGENRPIESNDTPEGRAYNRRVDIVLKR